MWRRGLPASSPPQVTVANCVEMFNDYCRAVLGPEFDPAVLLQYRGSPLDPGQAQPGAWWSQYTACLQNAHPWVPRPTGETVPPENQSG